jgi:uncharacterized protein
VVGLYFAWTTFGGAMSQQLSGPTDAAGQRTDDEMGQFVGFVLDDIQAVWDSRELDSKVRYRRAKLVLFTDSTSTGCGYGDAATGPFYCPLDERVYIDLSFFRELSGRLGAPGDFAQAYVVAHEIGHHVQNLMGTSERVHRAPKSERKGADSLAVRLELQADCYAGVWAHSTKQRQMLDAGDIEEALAAAASIGDDRLQRQAKGRVAPESFTHGTSEQRSKWFRRGLESGAIDACDTFSVDAL